jgi:signal transduction histidine kinase
VDRVPAGATISGVVVHELRHDLARARALLDGIARSGDVGSRERSIATLADLLLRMDGSVESLLGGDADRAERHPTRVGELIERIVAAHDPDGQRVSAQVPALVMNVDPVKVERIVDNLLANALHHAPAGTPVRLTLRFERGSAVLCVADEGPGVPPEVVDRLEDEQLEGEVPTGLGVVARFARAHGGRVRVEGPGAQIYVELPASNGPGGGP